jgi:hypothetical protein
MGYFACEISGHISQPLLGDFFECEVSPWRIPWVISSRKIALNLTADLPYLINQTHADHSTNLESQSLGMEAQLLSFHSADEFDLCCMLQKVKGHINSKRPIYDIVFNEEFISKPLTKCWSGNRWTNV